MSITEDVKAYADLAIEQGKHAVDQGKQFIGVAQKQVEVFVAEAPDSIRKPALAVIGAGGVLWSTASGALTVAQSTYVEFADRGTKALTELAHDPRVGKVLSQVPGIGLVPGLAQFIPEQAKPTPAEATEDADLFTADDLDVDEALLMESTAPETASPIVELGGDTK